MAIKYAQIQNGCHAVGVTLNILPMPNVRIMSSSNCISHPYHGRGGCLSVFETSKKPNLRLASADGDISMAPQHYSAGLTR